MSRVVTLKINDKDVSGREDETILELAQENGIFIPTLCHLEGLSDIGACRRRHHRHHHPSAGNGRDVVGGCSLC